MGTPGPKTEEGKARSLANLRPPIQKGEVLNPNGRRGKLSPLAAIAAELKKPYSIDDPAGITKLQRAAERLVGLATDGTGQEVLSAWNMLLRYFEGEPTKPMRIEIRRTARRIAEETGADYDWLLNEAERIALEAYDNDEVEQGEVLS